MTAHRHVCDCGAVLLCSQEPDQCPIRQWECPRCLDQDFDLYVDQLEADSTHNDTENMTDEHQQRIS